MNRETPSQPAAHPRRFLSVVLGAVALGAGYAGEAAAQADTQGPEPEYTITYNVGVTSNYRVRGIAQTSDKPALQGGIDFAHKSGFYLGTAASNVRWIKEYNGATKGSLEVDLYGGYRNELMTGLTYDVGVIRYEYPGNNSGVEGFFPAGTYSNASTTEIYGALTYSIATLKVNRSIGDFLGNLNSSGSLYFDLSAAIDLTHGFTLTPHVGHQTIEGQVNDAGDYTDYALTVAKDFGNGFVVTVAGTTTNGNKTFYTDTRGRDISKSALIVGAKYSF